MAKWDFRGMDTIFGFGKITFSGEKEIKMWEKRLELKSPEAFNNNKNYILGPTNRHTDTRVER